MVEVTAQMVAELREKTGLGILQCKKALTESGGDMEKAIEYLRKQGAAVAAKRVGKETKEGKVILASGPGAVCAVEINCETDFVSASDDFNGFTAKVAKVILDKQPADPEALKGQALEGTTVGEVNTAVIAKIGEMISIRRFTIEKVGANELAETYSHGGGKIGVIVKLGYAGEAKDKPALSGLAKDLAMQVAATMPIAIEPKDVPASVIEKEREIGRELTLKEGKTGDIVDKIVEGKIQKFYKENCLVNQVYVKDSKLTIDKLLVATAKSQGLESIKVLGFHRLQLGQ
ncbi:MAG TPA: translation elongation factor Ts [Fibrobacteria bacterium]|nr:translation elongation factor Ts [Fibrobacteria bacterium]